VGAPNMATFKPTNDSLPIFHSPNETSAATSKPINDSLQIITKFTPMHTGRHYPSSKGGWFRLVNNVIYDYNFLHTLTIPPKTSATSSSKVGGQLGGKQNANEMSTYASLWY